MPPTQYVTPNPEFEELSSKLNTALSNAQVPGKTWGLLLLAGVLGSLGVELLMRGIVFIYGSGTLNFSDAVRVSAHASGAMLFVISGWVLVRNGTLRRMHSAIVSLINEVPPDTPESDWLRAELFLLRGAVRADYPDRTYLEVAVAGMTIGLSAVLFSPLSTGEFLPLVGGCAALWIGVARAFPLAEYHGDTPLNLPVQPQVQLPAWLKYGISETFVAAICVFLLLALVADMSSHLHGAYKRVVAANTQRVVGIVQSAMPVRDKIFALQHERCSDNTVFKCSVAVYPSMTLATGADTPYTAKHCWPSTTTVVCGSAIDVPTVGRAMQDAGVLPGPGVVSQTRTQGAVSISMGSDYVCVTDTAGTVVCRDKNTGQ